MRKWPYFLKMIVIPLFLAGCSSSQSSDNDNVNNDDVNKEEGIIFQDNFDGQPDWQPSPGENNCEPVGAWAAYDYNSSTANALLPPSGWSYYRTTGWWWGPSYQDTVRITGEEHRGPSGKAYIQWNESNKGSSGDGWGADGILAKLFPVDYNELYIRFWIKMKPGFQWPSDNDGMLKIFRVAHYDRQGSAFLGFPQGNLAPIYLFDFKQSLKWGWRHMHSFRSDPQETCYYSPDGSADDALFGSGLNFNSEGQMGDDKWHRLDFHIKMNTNSSGTWQSDGVLEFWYDGELKYSIATKKWICFGEDTTLGWNMVSIGGNAYNNYSASDNQAEQWYAIDDFVVSTTLIPGGYIID